MRDLPSRCPGLRIASLLAVIACLPSCATVTGVATGAFTGFIDLPKEIIREQRLSTDSGDTWLLAILAAPVGFVGGPIFGLIKGVALDISAMNGVLTIGQEFGTMERTSVWRPYSFDWNQPRAAY